MHFRLESAGEIIAVAGLPDDIQAELKTSGGAVGPFSTFLGGNLMAFATNVGAGGLDDRVQGWAMGQNFPSGTKVYVGYGSTSEEMIAAGRYKQVFIAPA